jgi:hypothetical protein
MRHSTYPLILALLFLIFGKHTEAQQFCPAIKQYGTPCQFISISANYQARLVQATIKVDSAWSLAQRSYKKLSILSMIPFDTTIYSYSMTEFFVPDSLSPHMSLDTFGIIHEYVDSFNYARYAQVGDTLKNVFLFQETSSNVPCQWTIVDCVCYFLQLNNAPPFPLSKAIQLFNSLGPYARHHQGTLGLGPVIEFGGGDPAWEVRAHCDATYWYISHAIGSGDCPAGCTEWVTTTYKISENTITPIETTCNIPSLCNQSAVVLKRNGIMKPATTKVQAYTVNGKKIGSQATKANVIFDKNATPGQVKLK